MKKLIGILLFLSSSVVLATNNSFLFLQNSNNGELSLNKDKSYSLSLHDTPPYVGYFADRPVRQSGTMPLTQFLNLWSDKNIKNNFSVVPPNAAVAMITGSGQQQNFIAIVSNPLFTDKSTVTYTLKVISNNQVLAGHMNHIYMFFDDIHWNPGGFGN